MIAFSEKVGKSQLEHYDIKATILSFLFPLIQEEQLSFTGESRPMISVHLAKRTETNLIKESDRSALNDRIGLSCAGRAKLQ